MVGNHRMKGFSSIATHRVSLGLSWTKDTDIGNINLAPVSGLRCIYTSQRSVLVNHYRRQQRVVLTARARDYIATMPCYPDL